MTRSTHGFVSCLLFLICLAGCAKQPKGASGGGGGAGRAPSAFPVDVSTVSTREVQVSVSAVGSVEAYEIVQVTARVAGAVEAVRFREGDAVREGSVLVEIEPERYRLAANEANAALDKARAALDEAQAGLSRREGANEKTPGLIPGEEIDAWRTRVVTARAEVAAREAALQLAERNADDANTRAPFAGTIQSRNVQTGQYVQPGTLLTTLVRRDPLLLRFQIPEGDAARIEPGMTARFQVRNVTGVHSARIVHVAAAASSESRMVPVTAEIERTVDALRPGSFAEITIPVGTAKDAAVIPQTAVRPSERGFLAFVVAEGRAHERVLTLGLRTADGLVEVREGLAPGESLVVRGAEALREGANVVVAPAAPADSAKARSADSSGQRK